MTKSLARRAHNATNALHSLIYFAPETEHHLTGAGRKPGRMCYFAGRAAPMGAVGGGVVARGELEQLGEQADRRLTATLGDGPVDDLAAVGFALVNQEVLIGEGCDLGKMGYAEHLLATAEGLELVPHRFGRAAADADVDLVEDQRARGGILLPGF